jgi:hypothetical protein
VRLVGMLAPQGELVAILSGGGLLQAMLADRSEGEQPWVPVVSSCLMVHGRARRSGRCRSRFQDHDRRR